jgi:hypothetical protein
MGEMIESEWKVVKGRACQGDDITGGIHEIASLRCFIN